MIRFAFYGRVSTEDQQDPQASRNWQRTRANSLIDGHGAIREEYFDVGLSRSIPWKRRLQASRLLAAMKDPERSFDAVVIGEPQRAFFGNQYGLTYPVLQHYGVALWVPEVGGAIDPESEAHDLVMSVFAGMSKGERNRIRIRVRTAMAAQAQIEGRFLGGRPPYGYQLTDAGPHPNPAKAADGRRLQALEPDPITGPIVQRIYAEYLAGYGIFAIAQRLTADGVLSPSAADPGRNRHRSGDAWSKSALRTILTNRRYTGRQVWNRQRKQESLIDVEDVGLGHQTRLAWNPSDVWVVSDEVAHPALVAPEVFEQVQRRLASRSPRTPRESGGRVRRPYALRGLVRCSECGRKMQGTWNHGRAHYRCRFPSEYALVNRIEHPAAVYLREDAVVEPLDAWLAAAFDPGALARVLAEVDEGPVADTADEASRRELAECDRLLARHRAALEAGADAQTVAEWTRDVRRRRAVAEASLRARPAGRRSKLGPEEIATLVDGLGGLITVLREADTNHKCELYQELGVSMTYQYRDRAVRVDVEPRMPVDLTVVSEGGLEPPRPYRALAPQASASAIPPLGPAHQSLAHRLLPPPTGPAVVGTSGDQR
jgi:site-specific DNA recombinase